MTDEWLTALDNPGATEETDLLAAFVAAARAHRAAEDRIDLAEGELRDGYNHDEELARTLSSGDEGAVRLAAAAASAPARPRARFSEGGWILAWVPDAEGFAVCLAGPGPATLQIGEQGLLLVPGRWTAVAVPPPERATLAFEGRQILLPRREG